MSYIDTKIRRKECFRVQAFLNCIAGSRGGTSLFWGLLLQVISAEVIIVYGFVRELVGDLFGCTG